MGLSLALSDRKAHPAICKITPPVYKGTLTQLTNNTNKKDSKLIEFIFELGEHFLSTNATVN